MSSVWSLYISVLTLGTLVAMGWLLYATRGGQPPAGESKSTGDSFDGIEEYDNPLPRWWLWLFVATLVFAVVYLLLYPGLGNWRGLLPGYGDAGWSSVREWEQDQAQARASYAPLYARYAAMPVAAVAADPQALATGARLFANNCALCHGADGQGAPGAPNLTDDLWRWGGTETAIKKSIAQGRRGIMPAWGAVLGEQGSRDAAAYVLHLNGRALPEGTAADLANGQRIYAQTCVACHGAQAQGNPLVGAPDLNQARGFIHGASFEQVLQSIRDGRQGQMPAQTPVLGDDRVHLLAAYVYSLAQPPAAQASDDNSDAGEAAK